LRGCGDESWHIRWWFGHRDPASVAVALLVLVLLIGEKVVELQVAWAVEDEARGGAGELLHHYSVFV
jgi:hypothetical protein